MKKYNIIYADPPWSYNDKRKCSLGGCENHYNTMKLSDIQSLPIQDICEDNCALFLWVTFPLLKEGIATLESWGFKYKTVAFNWIKTNKNDGKPFFGIGYYTKSNAEICLLGIKGKMKPISNKVSSIVIYKRQEHSKKPDIIRNKIVELFGDIPRVELFARNETIGWDVFGNEVENSIEI